MNSDSAAQERIDTIGPEDLLIVLIGASAVGKSTIARHLCVEQLATGTPTTTDRPPRTGELSTEYDHRFVSSEAFDVAEANGLFIAIHGLYGARYGMPLPRKPQPGRVALMVLKPVFMPTVIATVPQTRVYQIEAPEDLVRKRMVARGQSDADIERRMAEHATEATEALDFSDYIFNNDGMIEKTLDQVKAQLQTDIKTFMPFAS